MMAEIRHWKSTWCHFSAEGGPIWIKFHRLVQNDMSTAVIWSKSKPDVDFKYGTFGRIKWHVIPEPRITLQGAATWWINCRDFRATCHIAGCKNSIRHIENRLSPYFIYNAVWAMTSGWFLIVSITLVYFGSCGRQFRQSASIQLHVVTSYCVIGPTGMLLL